MNSSQFPPRRSSPKSQTKRNWRRRATRPSQGNAIVISATTLKRQQNISFRFRTQCRMSAVISPSRSELKQTACAPNYVHTFMWLTVYLTQFGPKLVPKYQQENWGKYNITLNTEVQRKLYHKTVFL